MTDPYDLIVIGAGVAGLGAAQKCASRGWRVAIVDELPYGGTCALRGCDPKKILRRGAEVIADARMMQGKGIDVNGLAINWTDLMAHKHGFTDPVPEDREAGLSTSGVDTLHGRAVFATSNRIEVEGVSYEARHFLIATGSKPRPMGFPGAEHLIDSTDFLDLEELPRRILFVGGGFISFEFAHISARAGSTPTIIDRGKRPLKMFDPDLVDLLAESGVDAGITVSRESAIQRMDRGSDGYSVSFVQAGTSRTVEVDLVVHGAGRMPDLSSMGLEAAGVAYSNRGVTVSGDLQSTTNPAVFAAGDSADTPGMPLTPVAVSEGGVAASNMMKGAHTVPDYIGEPSVVFTVPELARVGLLEEEAIAQGLNVDVRYNDTSGWYSNYRIGQPTAASKVLVDRDTDLIVGAHLLGPGYSELINFFALAMKIGLTACQLRSAPASYPSVTSDLASML